MVTVKLECVLIQHSKVSDVVVFNSEGGECNISIQKGDGDKLFEVGKFYNIEIKEASKIIIQDKKLHKV